MSKAAANARDSMKTFRGAVGRDNAVNMDALAAGAAAMDRGESELRTAEASFKAASERAQMEAAERGRAAEAYDLAGMAGAARVQRGRAEKAQRRQRTAAKWASNAAEKAGQLGQARAMWDRNIAESSDGDKWEGDGSEWRDMNSRMCAGFGRDRAKWAELAGAAAEAEAVAVGRLERAAAAAKRAAGTAYVDPAVPEARKAVAEAIEAAEAARQAVAGE